MEVNVSWIPTERASDEPTEVSPTTRLIFTTAAENSTDNDVSDSNLAQLRKKFTFYETMHIIINSLK
jgi:hypothetical protein